MDYNYRPRTRYEKFGLGVYRALAQKFPQTYFVGGMVRDLLLGKKITDIDLATAARPEQVQKVLEASGIRHNMAFRKFGVVRAQQGKMIVEVATFRQDIPAANRYPEVRFVKAPKADSGRRDFTVNALYYDPRDGRILDFHGGLADLRKRRLKFIGVPARRIAEDPLRIIRALRFQAQLNFKLDAAAAHAIKKYFSLTKKLSRAKIEAEILKLPTSKQQKTLRKIINSYPLDAK